MHPVLKMNLSFNNASAESEIPVCDVSQEESSALLAFLQMQVEREIKYFATHKQAIINKITKTVRG